MVLKWKVKEYGIVKQNKQFCIYSCELYTVKGGRYLYIQFVYLNMHLGRSVFLAPEVCKVVDIFLLS